MNQIKLFAWMFAVLFFSATLAQGAQNIGALGRIFPQNGIISLAGAPGDTIEQILVSSGNQVQKGDLLVSFASKAKLKTEVSLARSALERIESTTQIAIQIQIKKLETIRSKSKGMIALQDAEISTAKESLGYADNGLIRLLSAGKDSFSTQQKEEREHQKNLGKIRLNTALAELERLKTNRRADLALANMELTRLKTAKKNSLEEAGERLETVLKNLENADLKAPSGGTILDVLSKKGEKSTSIPIIKMADLSVMTVIADVFQADLLKISNGMKASITSKSLPETLTGRVSSIGRVITDPSKVAKVVIILDEPALAARLINLEVDVSILAEK